MDIADSFAKSFRQNKFDTLKWSSEENIIKASRNYRENIFPKYNLNFSNALLLALRKSVFGCYLNVLNPQQYQDEIINENKLAITEYIIKNLKDKKLKTFEDNNQLFEDVVNVLKRIIKDEGVVEMNDLMKNIQTLRVPDFYVHSSCHLLAGSPNFTELRSLDLSGNDIYNLNTVLVELRGLHCLRALQLEGNPCYVEPHYKSMVLKYFPNLIYLDNVEITEEDHKKNEFLPDEDKEPKISLLCHRIVGLRPPPKDAKNIQTIHIEFELPLLEKVHVEETKAEKSVNIPDKSSKKIQTMKKGKSSKATKTEGGVTKSSKESKSGKQKSPYDGPNEYDAHSEKNNFSFKTARMPWNTIMEFLPVFIESPEHDARAIRDTFRSKVEVRVVYLKTSRPLKGKPKKETKSEKVKKTQAKSTIEEKTPVEDILKRVTLCSFNCDLQSINWSDETIDYYWADHPKIGRDALRMDGCLKNLIYKKGADKKKTGSRAKEEPQNVQNLVQPIPKIFTCQVGFGLRRI